MTRPLAVVVGSGPTGVAAAQAALRRGARVLMLDVGRTLEPDRDAVRQRMARLPPREWTPADREILAGDAAPADDGAVTKALFGSDFAFRADGHLELDRRGPVALTPSLAQGGFSTVWGATLLPYTAADMADWPIDAGDLAPYYEEVLSSMPVAAYEDELASRYPLFTADHRPYPLGPQARALLGDLRRQTAAHRARHLTFGASRLALRAGHGGCVAAGACLHGCPYGYIWSAGQTLAALRAEEHFEYRSDVFVLRVGDSAVDVRSEATGAVERIAADRIFLAAGVLGTAAIVLAGLPDRDATLTVSDSQVFLLPLLQLRYDRATLRQEHVTLSEVFIDIDDPDVCEETVRLQVYGYSDSVLQGAARANPRLLRHAGRALRLAAPSLLTVFGYMHSRLSDSISVRLADGSGPRPRLELEPIINPAGREVMRRAAAKLRAVRRVVPLTPLLQLPPVGQSFHCGATFPMRERPEGLEADRLGRLAAFDGVHIVDASVFPSIPAGPITLSAMANASRIASEAWDA